MREQRVLPNVIVISLDSVRYDRTGLSPNRLGATPNLVRFAQRATVFHDATSSASWTVPAHLSIWTGLFPSRHGMTNKLRPARGGNPKSDELEDASLSSDVPTFPEALAREGYTAVAFTGGAGVSSRFGFGRGFSTYVDDRKFAGLDYSMPKALAWLRENRDRRFFMFLHGYDAHGQHPLEGITPKELVPAYEGSLDGSIEEQARLREKGLEATRIIGAPASLRGVIGRRDGDFLRAIYDRKIATADAYLGTFLRALEEQGLLERSIVAIVSDHGEEFMEHEHVDHGHSLFEEQTRVVFVVRFPGDSRPNDVHEPVQTLDLFPTLFDALELGAVAQPRNVDGVSLAAALRGRRLDPGRPVYAESDYRLFVHHRAVRRNGEKLVVDLRSGQRRLFDLRRDPDEQIDLAKGAAGRADSLDRLLDGWFARTRTSRASFFHETETPIKIF